ncbi:MAG: flagellar hook-basal body complex protein FliE [Deltaproteobacteria bacterium]|nr:flagellar hook-basal body complex protein FliE [Deltaproteobacteria bacterium]
MNSIRPISVMPPAPLTAKGERVQGKGFAGALKAFTGQVDAQIKEANQKTQEFAVGKSFDLHEIMIATEKADLSFRLLVQIRNKLMEAYQEVMRMQF